MKFLSQITTKYISAFPFRLPFRHEDLEKSSVVILGCGRSGTSILGELFLCLRSCCYFFEPNLIDLKNQISKKSGRQLVVKVPKGGNKNTAGLACDMDDLVDILGKIIVIWIVRHPLDAICSLRPGIENGWQHNPRPVDFLKYQNEPWYIKCAHHWNYINGQGLDSILKYSSPLIVRYEDLLIEPKIAIDQILDYTKNNVDKKILVPYINRIQDSIENSYQANYQNIWFRPDHTKRIERYRENMSDYECAVSWRIVSETAQRYGYTFDVTSS